MQISKVKSGAEAAYYAHNHVIQIHSIDSKCYVEVTFTDLFARKWVTRTNTNRLHTYTTRQYFVLIGPLGVYLDINNFRNQRITYAF